MERVRVLPVLFEVSGRRPRSFSRPSVRRMAWAKTFAFRKAAEVEVGAITDGIDRRIRGGC